MKIGNRVKLLNTGYTFDGVEATVVHHYARNLYGVRLDKDTALEYNEDESIFFGDSEVGWAVFEHEVEVIDEV